MMIKKAAILIFLTVISFSCSSDEEEIIVTNLKVEVDLPGEWRLVKMTGSIPNSETTGEDMYWQENYLFNNDGSFVKTRVFNNETYQFAGTFEVEEAFNNEYYDFEVRLTYPGQNYIIASCYANSAVEHLMLAGSILYSNYFACDGPGLYYEKLK